MSVEGESIEGQIFGWASSLPDWQQDAVVRLLESPEPSGEEIGILEQRVLAAAGIGGTPSIPLQEATEARFSTTTANLVQRIVSVGQLNGVGMVHSEQVIEFAEDGLTVVYGRNASGKSSYARTLKYLGRATGGPPGIHSNIREARPDDPPTAALTTKVGGSDQSFDINFSEPSPEACSSIRAFDSRSSASVISERNRIDFTPRVLEIFDRLAVAQKKVQERISERISDLEREKPDLSEFTSQTPVSEAIESLSAETDFSTIETLAEFTDEDSSELASLNEKLNQSPETAEALAKEQDDRKAEAERVALRIEAVGALVSDASIKGRQELKDEADQKSNTAEGVENRVFADAPLPELSPDAWRDMWEMAERYITSGPSKHDFPPGNPDNKCPLCYQDLDDAATTRFASFHEYLKDETANNAAEARRTFNSNVEKIREPLPALDGELLDSVCGDDETLKSMVDTYMARVEARHSALNEDPLTTPDIPLPESPAPALRARADDFRDRATQLRKEVDAEQYEKDSARKNLLTQKSALKGRVEELREWHETLDEIAKCRKANGMLSTASITRKHGQISEGVINETFAKALQGELDGLRLNHLDVAFDTRGSQGTRTLEITLPDAVQSIPLPEVLSEGEQRAIGLAAFLAGLVPEGTNGPLVIDDPVSSFDEDRREAAATRLVREAANRQVIIFTHDIAFARTLDAQGDAQDVKVKTIGLAKKGDSFGHVEPDGPVEIRKVKRVCEVLRQELTDYPADGTPAEQLRFADGWYPVLRRAWERAVEVNLLKEVVCRFERPVRTTKLDDINLTDELRAAVNEGMTRTSRFPHSAPDVDPQSPPTRQEMEDDAQALKDFVDLVNRS